jgi:hypothetical protein
MAVALAVRAVLMRINDPAALKEALSTEGLESSLQAAVVTDRFTSCEKYKKFRETRQCARGRGDSFPDTLHVTLQKCPFSIFAQFQIEPIHVANDMARYPFHAAVASISEPDTIKFHAMLRQFDCGFTHSAVATSAVPFPIATVQSINTILTSHKYMTTNSSGLSLTTRPHGQQRALLHDTHDSCSSLRQLPTSRCSGLSR